jgi:hypothetical protein
MVRLRVSQCTEFALREQRIFDLDMHLVRADLRHCADLWPADFRGGITSRVQILDWAL